MEDYSVGFTLGSIEITFGTAAFIIIYFLFIKNLMDMLRNVQPDNRQVTPGLVWILALHFLTAIINVPFDLGLIGYGYFPAINIISKLISVFLAAFQFYLFVKIANSIALEYDNRNFSYEHKPTFLAGIWLAIAYAGIFLLNVFGLYYFSVFASLGYLVAFFVYWFQTHGVKRLLATTSIKIETTDEDSIFKGL